jgi:acetate---CoA ligase (ADP-forming) subunit beta
MQAMLNADITAILEAARTPGWVLEPEALRLLAAAGLSVARHAWCRSVSDAQQSAAVIGYPVVAKVVSPEIMHKSDVQGVEPGIRDASRLAEVFERFSRLPGFQGMVVAEMLSGHELIVGSKIDYQFGPVILLGIGGTAVEVYRDTVTRLAPLKEQDVPSMLACLRGGRLLTGYRGVPGINIPKLTEMMLAFSELAVTLGERIDSIDLNPVFCSAQRCVIADARILLP